MAAVSVTEAEALELHSALERAIAGDSTGLPRALDIAAVLLSDIREDNDR